MHGPNAHRYERVSEITELELAQHVEQSVVQREERRDRRLRATTPNTWRQVLTDCCAAARFETRAVPLHSGQSSQSVVEQRSAAQDLSSLRVAESEVQQLDGFRSSSSTTTTGVKRRLLSLAGSASRVAGTPVGPNAIALASSQNCQAAVAMALDAAQCARRSTFGTRRT